MDGCRVWMAAACIRGIRDRRPQWPGGLTSVLGKDLAAVGDMAVGVGDIADVLDVATATPISKALHPHHGSEAPVGLAAFDEEHWVATHWCPRINSEPEEDEDPVRGLGLTL